MLLMDSRLFPGRQEHPSDGQPLYRASDLLLSAIMRFSTRLGSQSGMKWTEVSEGKMKKMDC